MNKQYVMIDDTTYFEWNVWLFKYHIFQDLIQFLPKKKKQTTLNILIFSKKEEAKYIDDFVF